MKIKIIPLLSFLVLTTVFLSSKGNGTESNCKLTCLPAMNECSKTTVNAVKKETAIAEYPFALAPGSYMFRY